TEFRPIVRHPGIRKQFHRRRCAPHQRSVLDQRPWLGQHATEELGHQTNRSEYVAVYLVRVVEHISSNLPAPTLGTSKLSKRFPFRSIQRRNHPIAKPSKFQGDICIASHLGKGMGYILPEHCNYRCKVPKIWLTLPPYRAG